jgi:hypothetical protein
LGLETGFGPWGLSASYLGSDTADPLGDEVFVVALAAGF